MTQVTTHSPFSLLPWQMPLWQRLQPAVLAQRVPHALMFTGAAGVGKRQLAQVLAASLLCSERDNNALPCGRCRSCQQFAGHTHPDFVQLTVPEDKKTISVDQVRAFSRTLYLRPQYAGARIGIVEPAERLFPNAANALLKTLEEPPAGSHILLVSEQPSAVIATVRSRCQLIRVPMPDPASLADWAQSQPQDVTQALDMARGAPLRAQALAEQDITKLQGRWLEEFLALVTGRSDPVTLAQTWQQHPLPALLDWLYLAFIDLLKLAHNVDATALIHQQNQQTLVRLSQRLDANKLRRACPRLIKARRLLDSNADRLLITEQLMITLWACRQPEKQRGR